VAVKWSRGAEKRYARGDDEDLGAHRDANFETRVLAQAAVAGTPRAVGHRAAVTRPVVPPVASPMKLSAERLHTAYTALDA
jgi:hypothetical protein